jgi:hypothetical protein
MSSSYGGTDTFPATAEIPDDSDPRDAASVTVPLEALFDRTYYLKRRGILGTYIAAADDETGSVGQSFTNHAAWTDGASGFYINIPGAVVGDILLIDCAFGSRFDSTDPTHFGKFRLYIEDNREGTPVPATPAGAFVRLDGNADHANILFQRSIVSRHVVAAAGSTRVNIQGRVTHSGDTVSVDMTYAMRVTHVRI